MKSAPPAAARKRLSRPRLLLGLLLLAAAAVRLAYWLEVKDTHLFSVPLLDMSYYHEWAARIVAGDWGWGEPYWMGPLYPHLLAAVYALFGARPGPPQILQWLLTLLNVWLVWRIGRRAFALGGATGERAEAAGLIAAALFAFYGLPVFYAGFLVMEVPLTTLWLLATWQALRAIERPRAGRWLALGLLIGAAGVARGNVLLLLALCPLLLRRGLPPAREGGRGRARAAVRLTAMLWLGGALAILPVTIRNIVIGGDAVVLTSNAGLNLYIGQQDQYGGIFAPVWLESERWFDPYGIRPLEEELGRDLPPSEISRIYTRRAIERVLDEPLAMARHYAIKTYRLLNAYELPQLEAWEVRRHEFPALRWLPVPYLLLSAAGLVGLFLLPGPARLPIALMALGYLASLLPFFPTARYRQASAPLLAIGTAAWLLAAWERWRAWRGARATRAAGAARPERAAGGGARGEGRALLLVLAPAILLAIALHPGWAPLDPAEIAWHAHVHDAIRAAKAGDKAAILPAIRKAEAAMPGNPVSAFRLGTVYEEAGMEAQALAAYEEAARRLPDDSWVFYRLGRVLHRQGKLGEALAAFARGAQVDPDWPRPYFGAAMVQKDRGDLAAAIEAMAKAAELAPGAVQYASNLAGLLAEAGRLDEARAALQDLTRRRPDYAPGLFNLAVLEMQRGDREAARAALARLRGTRELSPEQLAMVRRLKEALGLPH